jgi:hypothetical protein
MADYYSHMELFPPRAIQIGGDPEECACGRGGCAMFECDDCGDTICSGCEYDEHTRECDRDDEDAENE